MNKYELTYIVSSDVEKNKLEAIHKEISELIKKNEGRISEAPKSIADFEISNKDKKTTAGEKNQTGDEQNTQEQKNKSEQFFVRKKLAYPIRKVKSAYYAIINFEIEPPKIEILEGKLRLEKIILRYLIIKKEIKKMKKIRRERKAMEKISIPVETEKAEKEKIAEKLEEKEKPKAKKKKKIKLEDIQEKLDKILDI